MSAALLPPTPTQEESALEDEDSDHWNPCLTSMYTSFCSETPLSSCTFSHRIYHSTKRVPVSLALPQEQNMCACHSEDYSSVIFVSPLCAISPTMQVCAKTMATPMGPDRWYSMQIGRHHGMQPCLLF